MKSPGCASVVEAYAPTTTLGLATGLSFSPQVQVPAVPALPTAGLLQALAPKRGMPPPARGPAPLGVPKQQLEAMAKRLAMEAQVSAGSTPANKKGRPPIRPCPAAPAPASPSGPSAVATASPSVSGSLSHATTPSWRSRSQATPSAASQGTSEMACKPAMMADSIRPRLSPLLEARWTVVEEQRYRRVPQSELDRLDRIDPEVDQANAMLVESFLNVKRSLGAEALSESHGEPSRSSASRLPAPPLGNDSGLQNAGYQVLCSLPPAPPLRDPLESAYSCSTGADRSGF
ncbi:unnamed protein product [Symbiodinium sp. CCMP2456]|nr:unnamed protein product [Symbiodinium sp. CCMP2456]